MKRVPTTTERQVSLALPQVDSIFTETNATRVWAHGHAESDACVSVSACTHSSVVCVLSGHEKYAQDFADTC
jgi:hypothetical protein